MKLTNVRPGTLAQAPFIGGLLLRTTGGTAIRFLNTHILIIPI
jgi:hypothetical protein